jgi:hypothetical protein
LQCKLAYRYEGSTRERHPVMALVQHLPLAVNHLCALLHQYLYFRTSKASKIEHLPLTVNHREEAEQAQSEERVARHTPFPYHLRTSAYVSNRQQPSVYVSIR